MYAVQKSAANRHPVDQLADVRAQKKALEEREEALKAEISKLMGSANHLGGDEFIAIQSVSTRKGAIDEAALKSRGIDVPRKSDVTVFSLKIERRVNEVA